jgi:Fe-S-cluster containining protein
MHPDEIDKTVTQLTDNIWKRTDCGQCANCCKTLQPTLNEDEVQRLSKRLGMEPQKFIETFLEPSDEEEDTPWNIRSTPCPFLKDNRCSVYEDRPDDCRGYPYLHEENFTTRLWGMIERTGTCPIVYEVMEDLKPLVGFKTKRRR